MAIGGWVMSEFVVVLCTVASNESDKIVRTLVKERLAACVNIAPIRSCYIWEGKLNMDPEEILIIKTEQRMIEPLKKKIIELHSYSVPEIIVLPIIEGYQPYLNWISQSLG
jgi:periplasmic divalent cation tolerance protein